MTYIIQLEDEDLNMQFEFIDINAIQGTIEHFLENLYQLNKTYRFCCYNIRK